MDKNTERKIAALCGIEVGLKLSQEGEDLAKELLAEGLVREVKIYELTDEGTRYVIDTLNEHLKIENENSKPDKSYLN